MLNLAVVLLVAGIILLAIEAFFPGFGVCGISGTVSLVVSAILMVMFVPGGILLVAGEAVLVGGGVFFFFKFFKHSKAYGKIVLRENLNEDTGAMVDLSSYTGKQGVAKTALRPIGMVELGGVAVEAYSEGEFITAGTQVQVTSTAGGKLLVKPFGTAAAEPKNGNEN